MTDAIPDPWGDPAFEQAVRDTAYFLWEHDGRPEGREQDYWYAALEKCLLQRESDKSLKQSLEPNDVQRFGDQDKAGERRFNLVNGKGSDAPR